MAELGHNDWCPNCINKKISRFSSAGRAPGLIKANFRGSGVQFSQAASKLGELVESGLLQRSRKPSNMKVFRGFESHTLRQAGIAQLVEHLTCNQGVRGSSPRAGTIYNINKVCEVRYTCTGLFGKGAKYR